MLRADSITGEVVIDHDLLDFDVNDSLDNILESFVNYEPKFFYHFVADPQSDYEKYTGRERLTDAIKDMSASNRMLNIMKGKEIIGHKKGFLVNKMQDESNLIKSVSFGFYSPDELSRVIQARNSSYGICFYHDILLRNGLKPVKYINRLSPDEFGVEVFNNPHLVEVYSEKYDNRWENEWRIQNNFKFSLDNIAFIIIPQRHFGKNFHKRGLIKNIGLPNYKILGDGIIKKPYDFMYDFFYEKNHKEHIKGYKKDLRRVKEPIFKTTDIDESEITVDVELEALPNLILLMTYFRKYLKDFSNLYTSIHPTRLKELDCYNSLNNLVQKTRLVANVYRNALKYYGKNVDNYLDELQDDDSLENLSYEDVLLYGRNFNQ